MRRTRYIAFAVVTVVVGLVVNKFGGWIPSAARDILGDALWAGMMFWLVSAVAPSSRFAARVTAALAICYVVEFSQMYHTPRIDALRATTPGHLVLGTDFDARDLIAYTVGVIAAALCDRVLTRSSRPSGSTV